MKPNKKKAAIALVLFLIAALYVVAARRLPVGALNDDAANILLARSLRHGVYAFPGDTRPPFGFLPAFPALLAVPVWLVEPHWNLLRAVPLFFTALTLFLTWRLARRFLGEAAAGAAVLFTALNPVLVGHSGLVMPYLPYLALSLALIDGAGAAPTRRSWLLLTAGAALAPLLRPHGVVLVGALALALWHRGGPRKAGAFFAAALLPIVLWTLYTHHGAAAREDYPGVWRANIAGLAEPGALTDAVSKVLLKMLGQGFIIVPSLPRLGQLALGVGTLALALAGAFRILKARNDPRGFVLAAYTAGVFFLQMTWRFVGNRYVIPVVPMLWILIVAAAIPFLKKRRALAWTLAAVFVLLPLSVDAMFALQGFDHDARFEPETMAWIRKNTPPSARLESAKDYAVSLLTDRTCAPQHFVARGGEWLDLARKSRLDYLHLALPLPDDAFPLEIPPAYQPFFANWLGGRKEATEVFRDAGEGAILFRMNRTPGSRSF